MFSLPKTSLFRLARPKLGLATSSKVPAKNLHLSSENVPEIPVSGQIAVPTETVLPPSAQVVIAGAGMIGNAVASHLIQNGWTDVVIIDKGRVADGTSKTGSGVLGLFRPSHERNIVQYCIEFYRLLQDKGYDIGLEKCGSLNLANSKDRMISLHRRAVRYKPTGLECHILAKDELEDYHPHLYTDDLHGGVWVPDDSTVDPKKVSEVLAYLAYQGGAKFVGNCSVNKVDTNSQGEVIHMPGPKSHGSCCVRGVDTNLGYIRCDYFVNCGGIWARTIGKMSEPKVRVPICPAEHYFLTFKNIPELEGQSLPTVRDYDNHIYLRGSRDSFLMGAFEPRARPWMLSTGEPKTHKPGVEGELNQLSEEQWYHMMPFITSATNRMPVLKQAEYDMLMNTPDAFTPDGKWIIGEAPEVDNYFVCVGMNGNSLQGAAGVGKAIADWMTKGKWSGNYLDFELARFSTLHNNPRFLLKRTEEVVGRHYQLKYPLVDEFKTARRIRTSAIYSELEARGAVFGERMGWERPLYFMPHHSRDDPPEPLPNPTFGRPEFFENIEDECLVCREGVGLIDMSSFSKFLIKGDNALPYMQMLCSNDIDIPIGGIVSTAMLNESGSYENDCLVVRKHDKTFMMVCPTQQQTRIMDWMDRQLAGWGSISVQDVTSMYTVLTLVGPKAKNLMEEMCETRNLQMNPFTFRYFNMSYASGVKTFSVTQTGEPGYSLYVPVESALHLYDKLMRVGKNYGIRNVGQLAMRFLRIERFIPFWGDELNADTNPIEANRTGKVCFDKANFIGKEALVRLREGGVTKRLVQFHLLNFNKDTDLWPGGGEALYRDGQYVGCVTNSAYGFTLEKMVCLGFVQHPENFKGCSHIINNSWLLDRKAVWTVEIAGSMIPAQIHLHPPKIPQFNVDVNKDYKPKKAKPGHAPIVNIVQKVKDKATIRVPYNPKSSSSL